MITKADDMAGAANCKKRDGNFDLDEVRILLNGNTAVVNARTTFHGMKDGQPITSKGRFTDVLVWRDGRWQIVAGHNSRITPPAK